MKGPQWAGQVDKDGWITAPNDKTMRYHPLPAPEITTLPHSALEALSNAKPGANGSVAKNLAGPKIGC